MSKSWLAAILFPKQIRSAKLLDCEIDEECFRFPDQTQFIQPEGNRPN